MGSEVDCSGVSRAVWLVKVPKYLSNIWMENTDASGIVGSLQITNNPQRNEVAFKLSDALANKEDENINKKEEKDNNKKEDRDTITNDVKDKVKVPREYKMVLSKVEQSMGMFSERTAGCIAYVKVFLFVIPPNSNTFSDLGRTCHVLRVKTP